MARVDERAAYAERKLDAHALMEDTTMKSALVKRSIVIAGHKTSISLEDEFWNGLKEIVQELRMTLTDVVGDIDARRSHSNLSSAIRLFILGYFRSQTFKGATGRLNVDKRAPQITQLAPQRRACRCFGKSGSAPGRHASHCS